MLKNIIIITLLSGQFIGDNANVKGIRNMLVKKLENSSVKVDTVNIEISSLNNDQKYEINDQKIQEAQNEINKVISQDTIAVILGAGSEGKLSLEKLHKSGGNIKFYWSGHQLTKDFTQLEDIDAIIVPKSAFNNIAPEIQETIRRRTKVIQTIGVPHDKSVEQIKKAYDNWQMKLPNNAGLILVVLPGDAPDANDIQHCYTPENAENLGYMLGNFVKEHNKILLVTNGPRTGKFVPGTTEIMNNHKPESPMDHVSKAFKEAVIDSGLSDSQIIFSDFKFGKKNLYDAFLGAIASNDSNIAVIAGESTTQVTQASNLLKPGQIYVLVKNRSNISNDAMNANHISFINDMTSNGYVQEFPGNYKKGPFQSKLTTIITDAEIVVDAMLKDLGLDSVAPVD